MVKKNPWFKDKYFIITGGSSGIGLAISKELLSKGAKVIIVSYNPNEFADARKELETIPNVDGKFEFFKCDITKAEDRTSLRKDLKNKKYEIAGLVNNAGITTYGPFFKTPSNNIERLMKINFVGSIMFTRDLFPLCLTESFIKSGEMRYIVFISSTSGKVPFPYIGGYPGTKRGVEYFLDALSYELPKNVKILRIRPGAVSTHLYDNAPETDGADIKALLKSSEDMNVVITAMQVAEPLVKAIIKKKSGYMYPDRKTKLLCKMLTLPLFGKKILKFSSKKFEVGFKEET